MAGTATTITVECKKYLDSKNCPVAKAFDLRRAYLKKLAEQEAFFLEVEGMASRGTKLQNAVFVKQLCESFRNKKNSPIDPDDTLEKLRHKSGSEDADCTSFEESCLYTDIENLQQEKQRLSDQVEEAAKDMVAFLRSKEFQDDLLENHGFSRNSYRLLTPQEMREFYPEAYEKQSDAKIRKIDHIAAVLTEKLALSEAGRELLAELLADDKLKNYPAFDAVWGLFTKGKSVIEGGKVSYDALVRFLQNTVPVIDYQIKKLIRESGVTTIEGALSDPTLKRIFGFFDKNFGMGVQAWIDERSSHLVDVIESSIKKVEREHLAWTELNDQLSKRAYAEVADLEMDTDEFKKASSVHENLKKMDSAPLLIALDSFSLLLSFTKIAFHFEKTNAKDALSAVNDLVGLTKTALEIYEASLAVKAAQTTGKAAKTYAASAKVTARWAKGFGIAGGILSTIICVIELREGIKRSDSQVIGFALAGAALGVGTIVAAACSAAVLSGILAVLGLVVAILAMIFLEPPILDYLEDIYWGRKYFSKSLDKQIKIADTIDKFYQTMYTLRVYYWEEDEEKDWSRIEIKSGMIQANTPIHIQVSFRTDNKRYRFLANQRNINGKGFVSSLGKEVRIQNLKEIWGFLRQQSGTMNVKVGIDMAASLNEDINKMPLSFEKNYDFDFRQEPILKQNAMYAHPRATNYGVSLFHQGTDFYFNADQHRCLPVHIFTSHAKGLKALVEMFWVDRDIRTDNINPYDYEKALTSVTAEIVEEGEHKRTVANFFVRDPGADYYKAKFRISLLRDNTPIQTTDYSPIYIARDSYIRSLL